MTNNYLTFIKLTGLFKIFKVNGFGYDNYFYGLFGNGGSEFNYDDYGDASHSCDFEGKGDGEVWSEKRVPGRYFQKGTEPSWASEYSVCDSNGELYTNESDDT